MKLPDTFTMDKTVFSTVSLTDKSDEPAYWQTQTPQTRLAALEFLRQICYGYNPSTERIPRVIEVIKYSPR